MFGALLFGIFIFSVILFLVIFLDLKFTLSDINIHSSSWLFFYSCRPQYIFSFLQLSASCTVVSEASFLWTMFFWMMFLWSTQQVFVSQLVYWDHLRLRWILSRWGLSLDVSFCCLCFLSFSISLASQWHLLIFKRSVLVCLECFLMCCFLWPLLWPFGSQCPHVDLVTAVSISPFLGERSTTCVKCGSCFLLGLFPPLLFKCNCCILYFLYLRWVLLSDGFLKFCFNN